MCLSGSSPQGREPVHAARTAVCLVTVRHSSSVVHRRIVTFGPISFHLVERALVPVSGVPLLYAGAMAALVTGCVYDRLGGQILLTLPFIVAAIRPLAFGGSLAAVVVGVLLWGAAVGVQDSTVKALVAHLVKRERRAATAYGIFAAVQGAGALLGGVIAGALYERSVTALVIGTAAAQAIALLLLAATVVEQRRGAGRGSR
jgi:predicted MFS family arabinose efflux permease